MSQNQRNTVANDIADCHRVMFSEAVHAANDRRAKTVFFVAFEQTDKKFLKFGINVCCYRPKHVQQYFKPVAQSVFKMSTFRFNTRTKARPV